MIKEFKIHIENRTIVLVNEFETISITTLDSIIRIGSIEELSKVLDFFQSTKIIQNVFLKGKPCEVMFEEFSRFYKIITNPGGLVRNSEGNYLMIYRRGHWDLPKGKPEGNETVESTALREVSEETGISNLSIRNHLIDTYHTYQLNGNVVLKKTVWFHMEYNGNEMLKPQVQEEITDAKWVRKEDLNNYLSKSYLTISEVFNADLAN